MFGPVATDSIARFHEVSDVRLRISIVLLLACLPLACIHREHRELREAQDAYRVCAEAHGPDDPRCAEARAKQLEVQERYEDRARKAWNCETSPDECPRRQ